MTDDSEAGGEALERRRRRLIYRSWHRGTREMDLLLGRFVERYVGDMSPQALAELEALLDIPDAELFSRLMRESSPRDECDAPLLTAIRDFHRRQPIARDAD